MKHDIYSNIANAKNSRDLLSALKRAASGTTAAQILQKEHESDLKLAHTVARDILKHDISDEQAERAVNTAKSLAEDDSEFYDALKIYFNN